MRYGNSGRGAANVVTAVIVPALHRAATILKRSGIDTVVYADAIRREARLEFVTRHGVRRPATGGRFMHLGFVERGGLVFAKGYGPGGMTNDGAVDASKITESDVLQRALDFGWHTDRTPISVVPPLRIDRHA